MPRRYVGVVFGALLVGCALAALEGRTLALGGIRLYQRNLAPLASRVGLQCRFTPTCSRYAEVVIARDGVVRGGWKAFKRIARCGPWTTIGTVDPP